jgi:hypothetical protein
MSILIKTCVSAALCGGLSVAQASTLAPLNLTWEATAAGTTNPNPGANLLAVPGTTFYGNSFSAPTAPTTPIAGSPAPGYDFYDDFVFTIQSASLDSVTASIDLGSLLSISNLAVRLYNTSGNPVLPVLSVPNGGTIDAWSSPLTSAPGVTGTIDVLTSPSLAAGTYVLEVRGDVTGTAGGSYSGTLNLSPVPIPAALPLILSGLGLLGGAARRRVG